MGCPETGSGKIDFPPAVGLGLQQPWSSSSFRTSHSKPPKSRRAHPLECAVKKSSTICRTLPLCAWEKATSGILLPCCSINEFKVDDWESPKVSWASLPCINSASRWAHKSRSSTSSLVIQFATACHFDSSLPPWMPPVSSATPMPHEPTISASSKPSSALRLLLGKFASGRVASPPFLLFSTGILAIILSSGISSFRLSSLIRLTFPSSFPFAVLSSEATITTFACRRPAQQSFQALFFPGSFRSS